MFQWVERDQYREKATRNHQRTITVMPQRGSIFDTNGNPLAVTVQLDAVSITGKDIAKDPVRGNQSIQKLAGMLGMQPQEIQGLVDPNREDPVLVRDQLPAALSDQHRLRHRRRRAAGHLGLIRAPCVSTRRGPSRRSCSGGSGGTARGWPGWSSASTRN